MSHTAVVKTKITDIEILKEVLNRLGLPYEEKNSVKLFVGVKTAKRGVVVQLPGWRYPILIDIANGKIYYDNYNGKWGSYEELEKLLNEYALEKVLKELQRKYKFSRRKVEELRQKAKREPGKIVLEVEV